MKQGFGVMIAIAIGTVLPQIAFAQGPSVPAAAALGFNVPKPLHFQVGAYFPTDSTLKDNISKNFVKLGASYDIWQSPALLPVVIGGFVDVVLPKERNIEDATNSFSMVGFGPQVTLYSQPTILPLKLFGGLGAGPFLVRAKSLGQSSSKSVLGAKIFVGAELASSLYATVDYTDIKKVSVDGLDYTPSGYGVSLGLRF
jgi:hypothetical protein